MNHLGRILKSRDHKNFDLLAFKIWNLSRIFLTTRDLISENRPYNLIELFKSYSHPLFKFWSFFVFAILSRKLIFWNVANIWYFSYYLRNNMVIIRCRIWKRIQPTSKIMHPPTHFSKIIDLLIYMAWSSKHHQIQQK